ncbi:MarR family winged helix-turn-helix transcriptional regulator [Tropicimonas sp. IMCC34011]|uniref:MarR family winged helix-turn-helix transcriptional regulator n=1 Tax=Tropicimonas sp. IMCC34011 TaxID=2248759 RepID=UPI000E26CA1F|nr:MarR family transcriptional regulator [Tropicimonas sp. IMCC34011]
MTDESTDDLALGRQICFPVYAASNMLTRLYRPALGPLGLTYPQYLVMLVLWEEAPQSVSSLGARLHLDSGTLTPLLKRLEASGYVTRARDAEDERRVKVSLTEAGAALRARAEPIPRKLAGDLGLSEAEFDAMRRSVWSLVKALETPRDAGLP